MLPVRFITRRPLSEFSRDLYEAPFQAMENLLESNNCCVGKMRIDFREEADRYVIDADLPGFTKDDLDITIDSDILTLSAGKCQDKCEQEVVENRTYHVRERRSGEVSRMLKLPSDVDASSITASLKNGVLSVVLEKSENAKPRKIDVAGE